MEITNDQFDRAFAEFQQIGSRQAIRVEDRWREILFDVEWRDFPALRERCEEIERFAADLAGQVREEQMTNDAALLKLAQMYPFLTRDRLVHTWSHAMSAVK